MVRGGFCQRSQLRRMEPAVRVGSGDVDVFRRDDQQSPARGVRQGVDFFTLADAQGSSSKQEKGNVGPEARGNVEKPGSFELLTGELEIAEECRCRVAGTAAEATSGWNLFLEENFNAGSNVRFSAKGIHGAVNEILLHVFFGEG